MTLKRFEKGTGADLALVPTACGKPEANRKCGVASLARAKFRRPSPRCLQEMLSIARAAVRRPPLESGLDAPLSLCLAGAFRCVATVLPLQVPWPSRLASGRRIAMLTRRRAIRPQVVCRRDAASAASLPGERASLGQGGTARLPLSWGSCDPAAWPHRAAGGGLLSRPNLYRYGTLPAVLASNHPANPAGGASWC